MYNRDVMSLSQIQDVKENLHESAYIFKSYFWRCSLLQTILFRDQFPTKKRLSKISFLKDIKRFVSQMAVCHGNEVFKCFIRENFKQS